MGPLVECMQRNLVASGNRLHERHPLLLRHWSLGLGVQHVAQCGRRLLCPFLACTPLIRLCPDFAKFIDGRSRSATEDTRLSAGPHTMLPGRLRGSCPSPVAAQRAADGTTRERRKPSRVEASFRMTCTGTSSCTWSISHMQCGHHEKASATGPPNVNRSCGRTFPPSRSREGPALRTRRTRSTRPLKGHVRVRRVGCHLADLAQFRILENVT